MQFSYLSSTVNIKTVSEDEKVGVFEIDGLFAGYGLTIGNALRRALLSSLPGAAITEFKIKGAPHEFSTIPGIKEDIVEISLNLKKIRLEMHTDEPQSLLLKVKGEKVVTAEDIKSNSSVKISNPKDIIATLTSKDAELDMEIKVERGLGYSPVESRKNDSLPIGTVAIDALFTPVHRVDYDVENMRVGERTDYNRLKIKIETDGTISPSAVLHKSANILRDHFEKVSSLEVVGQKDPEKDKKSKKEEKNK